MPGSANFEMFEKIKSMKPQKLLIIRSFNSSKYCLIRTEFGTLRFGPITCLQIRVLNSIFFHFSTKICVVGTQRTVSINSSLEKPKHMIV